MAFRAVLHQVPNSFTLEHEGGRSWVTVPLTLGDAEAIDVALKVRLWAGHWRGVPVHESKYAVVIADHVSGSVRDVFDRFEAAVFIEPVRGLVLPIVAAATAVLVGAVVPEVVYRATYFPYPPAASLPKHEIVTDMLVQLGYERVYEGFDKCRTPLLAHDDGRRRLMDRDRIKSLDWSQYVGSMPLVGVVEVQGEEKVRLRARMDKAFAAVKARNPA